MTGVFTFDSALHCYTLDGVVVPSVTTVLKGVGIPDLSFVDPDVLAAAARFGTAAHLACELDDRGELDEESLDENLRPLLNQWRELQKPFLDTCETDLCEQQLYSPKYRFAGTLDRAYISNGGKTLTIVDIKTGARTPSAGPQTAAYAQLVVENFNINPRTIKRYTAHLLHGEERGKLNEYTKKTDWSIFQSALNIHNYKTGRI